MPLAPPSDPLSRHRDLGSVGGRKACAGLWPAATDAGFRASFRAGLRSLWPKGRGSSNLPFRTSSFPHAAPFQRWSRPRKAGDITARLTEQTSQIESVEVRPLAATAAGPAFRASPAPCSWALRNASRSASTWSLWVEHTVVKARIDFKRQGICCLFKTAHISP